jgi:hypothetical protein
MTFVLRCPINGSKRKWTMPTDELRLQHAAQSAALRRKADRLNLVLRQIDRCASKHNREKHDLLSIQIMGLHETARMLQS